MADPRQGLRRLRAAAASGQLARVCDRLGVDLVSVFGSTVDPAATRPDPRDLDVAVRFTHGGRGDLVAVANALIDLTGTSEVDVLDLGRASVVARARALGPGASPLHEAEPGAYALAQMAALTEAMETAPMRRRDLELLAEG